MQTIILDSHTHLDGHFAATIGFFDGVHRGHRHLVDQLQGLARERGLRPMVVTFDRHPRQTIQPEWQPQLLTTLSEKEQLLRLTGIDTLVVLPFDGQMAALTAFDFMRQVLRGQLGVSLLLTGYDNRFGHRRADAPQEGFADYVGYGRQLGIDVEEGLPLLVAAGLACSSSLVRRQLAQGHVDQAAASLGRPYRLSGTVVHGQQNGHRMGYPTANLRVSDPQRLVPRHGVYATRVLMAGSRHWLPAMTNIGTRPTFDGDATTIETHIFNINADLYGQHMQLEFAAFLRDEHHFATPDALAAQMARDALAARKALRA